MDRKKDLKWTELRRPFLPSNGHISPVFTAFKEAVTSSS
jgi:hypothetical protein